MNKDLKKLLTAVLSAVCAISVVTSAGCFRKNEEKSKDDSKEIPIETSEVSECPFDISDNCEWTYYPNDNFVGLAAMGKALDESDQTFVLVFDKDAMDENAKQILTEGSVSSMCYYGYFDYEDKEIKDQDGCIYAKLKCDNRIHVVSFCFSYYDGDINEREIITIDSYANSGEGEKMELLFVHYDYGYPPKTDNTNKSQVYDLDKGKWDESIEEVLEREPETSIGYISYTELQVDEDYSNVPDTRYNTTEDIYMGVIRYDYLYAQYNIYQELLAPEEVRLQVMIGTPDSSPLENVLDAESFFNDNDIKLYVKSGDEYVDITPDTIWTEYEGDVQSKDDHNEFHVTDCTYNVHFQGLGELEEGYYKIEIGDRSYEFKLRVQYFEVW